MSGKQKSAASNAAGPDLNSLKKMVRLLEIARRTFIETDWKNHSVQLPRNQFNQLMLVRFAMPCNLGRIMSVTGLTSAGASLFVDKLVQKEFLLRTDDPADRRNVIISLSDKGREFLKQVDDRLDEYIIRYLKTCTESEQSTVDAAMRIICCKLDHVKDCRE